MPQNILDQPTVAIVIVTWNSENEIANCLKPLVNLPQNWEIWVSDNASQDRTVSLVKEKFPTVNLIENKVNLGFAGGCNRVIEKTDTDYILLLNPDTLGDAETFMRVLAEGQPQTNLGALGIKTLSDDGHLQTSCFPFPSLTKNALDSLGLYRFFNRKWLGGFLFDNFFDHQSIKRVDWLAGCFILIPRKVLTGIGNIPDEYFMFGEDIDLCYQIWRQGYEVIFYPQFEIIHKGNRSAGQLPSIWRIERTLISKYAFCFKYYGFLKTRLIQGSDYLGFLFGGLWLKFQEPNSILKAEWKVYRRVVGKTLIMNHKQMLDLLNNQI